MERTGEREGGRGRGERGERGGRGGRGGVRGKGGVSKGGRGKGEGATVVFTSLKIFARFLVLVLLHQTLPMISLAPKEDSFKQLYNFNILTTAFKLRIQKQIQHTWSRNKPLCWITKKMGKM
jgi:hypothetical protein